VPSSRLDLSKEVEWPQPEKPEKKKLTGAAATKAQPKKAQKRVRADSREVSSTPELLAGKNLNISKPHRPSKAGGKENREDETPLNLSMMGSETVSVDGTPQEEPEAEDVEMVDLDAEIKTAIKEEEDKLAEELAREEEIEKLRTGGSMTQNPTEIHRVRNLNRIQMGKHEIEPWYFSPYPASFSDVDMVYVDEFCLSYFGDQRSFERHRTKCSMLHPPGNEIYRDDYVSFFEVDGRRQRTWCRNLCLLSKLFLDHKTLYYDVDPFLFYCMTTRDEYGCHLVGYFSKEKESAEGYNVACILTLPQYQRKGYGRLLIAFSYELSKREGKLGSPEKPLSDLGLLGYRQYWRETLVELLLDPNRESVSESELASLSAMTEKDVHETLVVLNLLRYNVSPNASPVSFDMANLLAERKLDHRPHGGHYRATQETTREGEGERRTENRPGEATMETSRLHRFESYLELVGGRTGGVLKAQCLRWSQGVCYYSCIFWFRFPYFPIDDL
jgi:histone acetyltransferase HTATIP